MNTFLYTYKTLYYTNFKLTTPTCEIWIKSQGIVLNEKCRLWKEALEYHFYRAHNQAKLNIILLGDKYKEEQDE